MIMLKTLTLVLISFSALCLQSHCQSHGTDRGVSANQPAHTISQAPNSSILLLPDSSEKRIDADVTVVSTPEKDHYDKAAFWISVFLALVGVAGVIAAVCTLLFIKDQVIEMRRQRIVMQRTLLSIKKQSKEMSYQNRNIVAKERARLAIKFSDTSEWMTITTDQDESFLGGFGLSIENLGVTPASNVNLIYDAFACGEDGEESPIPSSQAMYEVTVSSYVLSGRPEQTAQLTIESRFSNGIVPPTFYVYVRGVVTYNTVFYRRSETTKFLYRREFVCGRQNAVSRLFWANAGSPSDNQST